MTALRLLLALVAPVALGAALLRALALPAPRGAAGRALGAALAGGLGIGLTSCIAFVGLISFGAWSASYFVVEGAGVFGLLVLSWRVRSSQESKTSVVEALETRAATGVARAIHSIFKALLVIGAAFFFAFAAGTPHGRTDAWMIWNLRARFLARGGDAWRDAFAAPLAGWSHPDYPLLVPATIARAWAFAGVETQAVPVALGALATAGTLALVVSAVSILRGSSQGLVAGALLLGTEFFLRQGASQYAAVPLAFFATAAISLRCLARGGPEDGRRLVLAGLAAGLAGWTKNEGLLFLAALVVSELIASARGGLRPALERGLALVAGAAAPLAVTLLFKATLAPPNDLVAGQAAGATLARLADPERYAVIARSLLRDLARLPFPVLAGYVACVGLRPGWRAERGLVAAALALALLLLGILGVFVTTPLELAWHLDTALRRLLIQLWPGLLVVAFAAARTPGEALARAGQEPATNRET